MRPRVLALIAIAALSSCGDSSPTLAFPGGVKIADVAGVWSYTSRLASITGGECFGPLLQSTIGSADTGTISITQLGVNLTAMARSNSDGSSCEYTGTASESSIALVWRSCGAANVFPISCTDGAQRELILRTNTISASVSGTVGLSTASGTQVEKYDVVVSGIGTGVGTLTASSSFAATKQ